MRRHADRRIHPAQQPETFLHRKEIFRANAFEMRLQKRIVAFQGSAPFRNRPVQADSFPEREFPWRAESIDIARQDPRNRFESRSLQSKELDTFGPLRLFEIRHAPEQGNLPALLKMPQADHFAQEPFPELRRIRQEERKPGHQAAHSQIFPGGTRIAKNMPVRRRQRFQSAHERLRRDAFPFERKRKDLVVKFGRRLHRFRIDGFPRRLCHGFVERLGFFAAIRKHEPHSAHDIQLGANLSLAPNRFEFRNGKQHGPRTEIFLDGDQRFIERACGVVQLVDENDRADAIFPQLLPGGKGLRFHTVRRRDDENRPIDRRQRHIDFGAKIHVTRRIDKVEPDSAPFEMRHARFDRDAALPLLGQIVHRRQAVFHVSRKAHFARGKENTLRKGRLSRIDMGEDRNVTNRLHRRIKKPGRNRARLKTWISPANLPLPPGASWNGGCSESTRPCALRECRRAGGAYSVPSYGRELRQAFPGSRSCLRA